MCFYPDGDHSFKITFLFLHFEIFGVQTLQLHFFETSIFVLKKNVKEKSLIQLDRLGVCINRYELKL